MKVLVTGGTGFVGQRLLKNLAQKGHQCVVLTRNPKKAKQKESTSATFYGWDSTTPNFPKASLEGVDAIINLMGENISNKRWSEEQKKILRQSRIDATQKLCQAVNEHFSAENPLKVFISASASGFYPVNTGNILDENSPKGSGFLADLCQEWEGALNDLKNCQRQVITRTGVILGPESGALNKLLTIFKLGAGGPIGDGKMMMSWIHVEDMVKALTEWLENEKYQGVYNMVAPNPVSNKVFTKALGKAVKMPAIFPVPPFMLKLMFGEMSSIILDSQNIVPKRLMEDGFVFDHPEIEEALIDLVRP